MFKQRLSTTKRLSNLLISAGLLLGSNLLSFNADAQAPGSDITLPDGAGKELVQSFCSSCHGLYVITRSGGFASAEQANWLISTMINLPDTHAATISSYLTKHFPEDESRRPTLIPGDIEIEIQEWQVPTLGQRSRDPIEAPDGSIWWTGMWASLVGRLDTKTGEMKEYPLPPEARPHSIVPDKAGNIWYTGNGNGTIGKLVPATGEIIEFKTQAGDPHTAVFHPNGNLYFTSQRAGMMGRLNPETGELKEVNTEARPYGIQVGPKGNLWIAHNGTNKIARMHPETLKLKYYDVPNDRTRIRRLDIDSNGTIWFVNSSLGKLGRLNPDTGDIKQWDSPSGATSHPYALAIVNDIVWYNESGMRPDALVRFDPSTESFQSWAIPSGVGIVRNMWVTEANNLLIHQTSSNRVGLVTIK